MAVVGEKGVRPVLDIWQVEEAMRLFDRVPMEEKLAMADADQPSIDVLVVGYFSQFDKLPVETQMALASCAVLGMRVYKGWVEAQIAKVASGSGSGSGRVQ